MKGERILKAFNLDNDEVIKVIELILQKTNNRVLMSLLIGFMIGYIAGFITAYAVLYWLIQIGIGLIKAIRG